jgi:hypothetical protein
MESAHRETPAQPPRNNARVRTLGELDRALRDLLDGYREAATPECEPFILRIAELSAAVSAARLTHSGLTVFHRGPSW